MRSAPVAAPLADEEVCERIRFGDASAVAELVARDHGVAELLARTVSGPGRPDAAVGEAWAGLITDVISGAVTGGLRAALLARVVAALDDRDLLDPASTPPPPRGPFLPPDDRWAGWWTDEPGTFPEAWPEGVVPAPDQVLRALRRLPLGLRVLLVLRDVAGISADEAQAVLPRSPAQQTALLETARDAYVAYVDHEIERGETG